MNEVPKERSAREELVERLVANRASLIQRSLARHKLVFVQVGAIFEPIKDQLIESLNGRVLGVDEIGSVSPSEFTDVTIIISNLEACGRAESMSLGGVREFAFAILDAGGKVCLISSAPRIAFEAVPGSSVLEDSAFVLLPLVDVSELELEEGQYAEHGYRWPSVLLDPSVAQYDFSAPLREMGPSLINALDHALYEIDPKSEEGLRYLSAREIEGLRGCGLVTLDSAGTPSIMALGVQNLLREAIAAQVSSSVIPSKDLAAVAMGLYQIERTIRHAMRENAKQRSGKGWRSSCVGGLSAEVLRRAQLDTNVSAGAITELRDPLEWLTLGELMDLVRSSLYDNLNIEQAIWRKLQEQLVPVRNRMAHVRMLRAQDHEIVAMWLKLISSRFPVPV